MRVRQAVADFLFGLLFLDLYRESAKYQRQLDTVLQLLAFGDMFGLPLIPTYYSLRLLPYAVAGLEQARREVLRERDLFEEMGEFDVH